MSQPVAIVTGAASGIGLAMTKHLLGKGMRVVMADMNETAGTQISEQLGPDTFFVKTDVSLYPQLASLFDQAYKWGGHRLDFFAANAGIDDKEILYSEDEKLDERGLVKAMNLVTFKVNLDAVVQGIWLFKYYARRNVGKKGGKVVITSSAAGLYEHVADAMFSPMVTNPLYTATKHGLVGLTRACGPKFLPEGITVNCICPAFVPTALCPPHVLAKFPKEHITPMSTVLKAVDTFIADDGMSGQVVELSLDQMFFREQPEYPNESQRWLGVDSAAFWEEAYKTS
ncbi:hypothetical protein D6D22_08703 [Aureobasidium pullulans]|uniref:NAD(P)-binding protein n=1 Tax=Aureobasidium pullulans TaxID=5580 RepID=A0A4S8X4R0_AURPU|nr:hypothetical protein D6D22_08703 [Aureobasidium pullulans]